jgi:hypothetical protein
MGKYFLGRPIPYISTCAEAKVFWFFSSEKNISWSILVCPPPNGRIYTIQNFREPPEKQGEA